MIKIIFFDLDETLMTHKNYSISKKTQRALKLLNNKEIKIVLCTGRNEFELKAMGVLECIKFDAMILMGGQLIKVENKVIFENAFNKGLIDKFIEVSKQYKLDCIFYTEDCIYSNSTKAEQIYFRDNGFFVRTNKNIDEVLKKKCYELSIQNTDIKINSINLLKNNYKIIDYHNGCYDLFPITGGKGTGVQMILNYYGIDKSDSMCFGDSMNDFDMFNNTGIAIAMGNANPKLKEISSYVSEDADNEGVYKGLFHFKLLECEEEVS